MSAPPGAKQDRRQKPPAFQFYAKDWLTGTTEMTADARGVYIDLLATSWDRGPLPTDPTLLARLARVSPATFRRAWRQMADKWDATEAGYVNARLETHRRELEAFRARCSDRGAKGAESRWHKHARSNGTRNAQAMPGDGSPICDLRSASSDQERKSVSPETALAVSSPAVMEFATVGHQKTWTLTEAQVLEWQDAFPGLDVFDEARRAKAWLSADSGRRKTAKGMARFLVGWLGRSADRGSGAGHAASSGGRLNATAHTLAAARSLL